jgi:DNA-3-methyladenine glycosylase I
VGRGAAAPGRPRRLRGGMELVRCFGSGDPLYEAYHDEEWGRPVRDERGLFERISLEAFQSVLSWLTILRKREAFRAAFAGFDPEAVARFDDRDVARLLADAGIVRNRLKVEATIANARATVALRDTGRPLDELVWAFAPPPRPAPARLSDLPALTPESTALAKELKRHGFRFVGPTTAYAAMQACGLVNDHIAGCVARADTERAQAA